ncbi:MAG TPA: discoidin domain-containing protein [Casimicrobiaceae bacterium]
MHVDVFTRSEEIPVETGQRRIRSCAALLRRGIVGAFLFVPLALILTAGPAAAQRLSGVAPACPVPSPTADQVVPTLLNSLLPSEMQKAWDAQAPATIDPYPPNDSSGNPQDKVINGIPIPGACNADADAYCVLKGYIDGCYSAHANVTLNSLTGLKGLKFTSPLFAQYNLKDVAAQSDRGTNASKLTDGVFAPEGHSSTDPEYAIVLPHSPNDPRDSIVVDLGQSYTICGNGYDCKSGPQLQADNDDVYQLDYSMDGVAWTNYSYFPKCCDSGLRTRGVAAIAGYTHNPSFTARYVRVFAASGGPTFAVSELALWDVSSHLISVGKRAVGPYPYQITSGAPPADGHSSTDTQYAVVLSHETGPAPALVVDLGSVKHVCGNGYDCLSGPKLQADNDDYYQLDYSTDGVNWTGYGQFPPCCDSNLRTRGVATITAGVHNPSFQARYLRVYANSGGPTFAVSQLELWDTGSKPLGVGAATYGPEPVITNGEMPPDGTDYNDTRYAIKLSPCKTNANSVCPTSTAQTGARIIDLGAAFLIDHLVMQADQAHTFQVDYSSDAASWQALWSVPTVSGSHLQQRKSPTFSPEPTARYLRVYGTGNGSVDAYSISALQVFTGQANTPCRYASDANTGENLACTYDGTFGFGIHSPFNISFFLKQAQIVLVCQGIGPAGFTYGSYVQESATNRTCTDTLNVGPSTPQANFCAGSCASGKPSALLSYTHLPGEDLGSASNPTASDDLQFQPTSPSSISCDGGAIDADIPNLAEQVAVSVATDATQGLFDGLLDYQAKPNSLIPFPPPHPPTNPPTFSACASTVGEPPPPGPYPDNISAVNGLATQVGTGASSATLHLEGRFTTPPTLALDQSTVTVGGMLHELRGAGELVQAGADASLLPVTLHAVPGSTPGKGIFGTPPSVKPKVSMQITPVTGTGAASGLMQFTLDVDRASIGSPSGCTKGSSVVPLGVSFLIVGPSGTPVWAHAVAPWQCDKSKLITAIGQ